MRVEARQLYRVEYEAPPFIANPPPPPEAVAILEDGTRYHLRAPEEFAAFYARLPVGAIAPVELAELLATFQAPDRHIPVWGLDPECNHKGLRGWFDPDEFRCVKHFTLPVVGDAPPLLHAFCTRFVGWPSDLTNALYRWDLGLDALGLLTWRIRQIASGLRCPFYQGPF